MKKIALIAALSALFAAPAFAQVATGTGTGSINVGANVGGSVQSIGQGASFSGASSFQSASFTIQPVNTATAYGTTQNVGYSGTTQTQGQTLAFNATAPGNQNGTGSASANGSANAAVSGTIALPNAHGYGAGGSSSGNYNSSTAGVNEANLNTSLTSSQFSTALSSTAGYGPTYNGFTNTNTASVGGSSYVVNTAQTGQYALNTAGIVLGTSNIPNLGQIGSGYSNQLSNVGDNTVTGNAGFWANASANNTQTSSMNVPTTVASTPTAP